MFRNSQHAADRFGLADAGNIYGRLTNSTQGVLEDRIAALEGGVAALAVASGAAAITLTVQALARAGAHVVAQKTIYGGTYNLLAHTLADFGVETTFANIHDLAEVEAAIRPETTLVYLETLGNPNSDIPDIDAVSALAHAHGLPVVVDNTFGTPYLIRPLEHAPISWCIRRLSSWAVTGRAGWHHRRRRSFDWTVGGKFPQIAAANPSYHGVAFTDAAGAAAFATYVRAVLLRDEGPCISPFNAWILLQGVETLSLRLDRHVENTKRVVEYLASSPYVAKVNHPSLPDHSDHELYKRYFPRGGASIFTFEIKGGQDAAWKFIDHLQVFSLLANVADVKSWSFHPCSTTTGTLSSPRRSSPTRASRPRPFAFPSVRRTSKTSSGTWIKPLLHCRRVLTPQLTACP